MYCSPEFKSDLESLDTPPDEHKVTPSLLRYRTMDIAKVGSATTAFLQERFGSRLLQRFGE